MNETDSIRNQTIRVLADGPGPYITIALSGNSFGNTNIELKDAIAQVRRDLETQTKDAAELMRPIEETAEELRGTRQRGGIVILRSPSVMQVHRVEPLKRVVQAGDRFDLRTLLCVAAHQRDFYVLALSQNRTRILKCNQDACEELPFPRGFPSSLAESMQTRQPDHDLQNRASGGVSIGDGSVVFGTSSDHDAKDEYMSHFFVSLDRAVNTALRERGEPLIAVGVESEIALYRKVNTYGHLVESGVFGAPDGIGSELHQRAMELLDQHAQQPGHDVPADFDKRVGTGHASTHIQEIVAAAYEGRVSHLFFQPNAQYMGTFDPVRRRLRRTDDPTHSPVDLIDSAAHQTLRQGGALKMLPAATMPNGVPVCALFRYPAVQPPVGVEEVEAAS
jgi:hypothetical protein